jgi:nucleoid-associated protein YgaU
VSDAAPGDWVPLPNLGKYRRPDDGPVVGTDAALAASASTPKRNSDDIAMPALVHTVRPNETFFSISQQYYGSGRYFRALWAANRRAAPSLDRPLIVGMTIDIPPPEALDASLFAAPAGDGQTPRELIRSTPRSRQDRDTALAGGGGSDGTVLPVGRPSSGADPISVEDFRLDNPRPQPQPTRSRYPVYIVKKGDTYRSIARDFLGTNERADEIRQLNLGTTDNPARPAVGQHLRMPLDARLPQEKTLR